MKVTQYMIDTAIEELREEGWDFSKHPKFNIAMTSYALPRSDTIMTYVPSADILCCYVYQDRFLSSDGLSTRLMLRVPGWNEDAELLIKA